MRKLLFVLPLLFLIFACKKEKNIVFSDLERAIENPKNNEISDADIAELLKLSDTTTLESIEDLEYRQFKIGKYFLLTMIKEELFRHFIKQLQN
ncbi:MAG: hypothetical protein IPN93_10255 [Bacteroidetes bacterium]|nr:hypothetical protein [Bacteroidota bacterium]